MRRCPKCKVTKENSEFYVNKGRIQDSRGLSCYCKICDGVEKQARRQRYKKEGPEYLKKLTRDYITNNPRKYWAYQSISSHRRVGYVVKLTSKELIALADKTQDCPICGSPIDWSVRKKTIRPNTPSLDRVNNETELNSNNTMIICYKCNRTKGERTLSEFIEYCRKVANNEPLRSNATFNNQEVL